MPIVGYDHYVEYSLLDKKVLVPLCGHLLPVFVCENPKPEPGFDRPCPNQKAGFRKRCPGLESLV